MTTRLWFLIVSPLMLLFAFSASAQFETPGRAFHNVYTFRLDGRHQTVPCESCHLNQQFRGTPRTCYECHWVRRKDDRFQTRLGTQCEQCHRTTSWAAVQFDHGTMTGMRLNSAHQQMGCVTCHTGGDVRASALGCISCHRQDYDSTKAPAHAAAGFPATCDSCHSAGDVTWQANGGRGFSHAAVFPLVGVHASQTCASCHKNNVYKGTPRNCVGCHQPDYARAQNPNHIAAGFPTTCDTCHRQTDPQWTGASFNHNQFFTLVGAHSSQTCATCHKNNVYKGTSRDCIGCHQADYTRAQNPNHVTAGFPTACESCHRPTDPQWAGASFNHSAVFPLVGVHASQTCATCHKNNVYKGTPRDCIGCHQADYTRAQNPNHVTAGFPTTCESCHRPTDSQWAGAGFNHSAVFPLVGVHASQTCATCHKNNVYKGTPRDCIGCHQADYTRAQNPNHVTAGFPTTCESCHRATDSQWAGAGFNHSAVFALVGVHASQTCATCHKNNVYKGTPRDCVGCHQADYTRAQNPNHVTAGFPTACESCHRATDSQWTGASFNHNQFFALVGVHATQACATCHKNNVYKGTARDCVGCHRANYDQTRNPNHAASGFPTTCDSCHRATDSSWTQGTFNHTQFPLTGRHNVPCAQCHTSTGNFKVFSCTVCHGRSETDSHHRGVGAYRYDSNACYSCHPRGKS